VLWGFFPAFWPLLDPAAPIEVLAHRVVWTLVLMAAVLSLLHGWRELRRLSGRGWLTVTAAALCIAGNWGLFIYGVAIYGAAARRLPLITLGTLLYTRRPCSSCGVCWWSANPCRRPAGPGSRWCGWRWPSSRSTCSGPPGARPPRRRP
jgi:hypothetical protein